MTYELPRGHMPLTVGRNCASHKRMLVPRGVVAALVSCVFPPVTKPTKPVVPTAGIFLNFIEFGL